MLIRTQENTKIVPMENFIIEVLNIRGIPYVVASSLDSDDCVVYLGKYDSIERAVQILDGIQSTYFNNNAKSHLVYQMPER